MTVIKDIKRQYVTRAEAAVLLCVATKTLANWHSLQVGPSCRRIRGKTVYHLDEIERFARTGGRPARKISR
jgi:hypothetical protein